MQPQPLVSLAPVSTKTAQPQPGQITMSPVVVVQGIAGFFWRFWPRRNPVILRRNNDALMPQRITSGNLEYQGQPPAYTPRVWQPSMGGSAALQSRGYMATWDSLPLPPRVVPLIMMGGKPSVVMGVQGPQRLTFKDATSPQRIPPIYVQNV